LSRHLIFCPSPKPHRLIAIFYQTGGLPMGEADAACQATYGLSQEFFWILKIIAKMIK